MTNQPWECPRCKRVNAPFNPICFCKPTTQEQSDFQEMKDSAKGQAPFIPGSLPAGLPYGYKRTQCSNCGGHHGSWNGRAVQCVDLQAGLNNGLAGFE